MGFFADFARGHEQLKQRIHNTRIPLGPKGRIAMGIFYLVAPVVGGYYVMQWTNRISERNLGVYTDASRVPRAGTAGDADGGVDTAPKIARPESVKKYTAMQRHELGTLLGDIGEDRDTGDWRDGPPKNRHAAQTAAEVLQSAGGSDSSSNGEA